MKEYIFLNFEYLLRILFAGICGSIIGYERKNRGKGAGIRTHIIVAIASCLMMIISKYGFKDLLMQGDFRYDPSRIASQIVSGVGFLGAGMIFIQKQSVKGLTTAAGIWATSGIGMAIGSGMYALGIITSFIILIIQLVLHMDFKVLQIRGLDRIILRLENSNEALDYFKTFASENKINIVGIKLGDINNGLIEVEADVELPKNFNMTVFLSCNREYIKFIDV